MRCLGRNNDDHCCYVAGKVCEFLEENTEPNFRWSCGLRRELGTWQKVTNDPRYLDGPGAHFSTKGMSCGDWPDASKGQSCGGCGAGK